MGDGCLPYSVIDTTAWLHYCEAVNKLYTCDNRSAGITWRGNVVILMEFSSLAGSSWQFPVQPVIIIS